MKEKYVARIQTQSLSKALSEHPVVVLHGARQTGKSTLAQSPGIGAERSYLSLDDLEVLDLARREPQALLGSAKRVTLDEVQREPSILLAVKRLVDTKRTRGRFLLTGSANLLLMQRISESLAGRAVYVRLPPLTWAERLERGFGPRIGLLFHAQNVAGAMKDLAWSATGPKHEALAEAVFCGGYPVPALHLPASARSGWFDGYVRTYLERDLRDFTATGNLLEFRRLMQISAAQTGRISNITRLARNAGTSPATALRYMTVLEASFQVRSVPAYAVNRSKRLIKAPKLFWGDTGVAAHLAGFTEPEELHRSRDWGMWLENWVLTHLDAWAGLQIPSVSITHYRTAGGHEVDFVLESARRLLPLEVKSTRHPRGDDIRSLELFLDEYPSAKLGVLLCLIDEPMPVSSRVLAVPIHRIFVEEG